MTASDLSCPLIPIIGGAMRFRLGWRRLELWKSSVRKTQALEQPTPSYSTRHSARPRSMPSTVRLLSTRLTASGASCMNFAMHPGRAASHTGSALHPGQISSQTSAPTLQRAEHAAYFPPILRPYKPHFIIHIYYPKVLF